MSPFHIRTARPDEAETVRALLARAEERLRRRGLGQWPLPFPDRMLLPDVLRQQVFLVDDRTSDIATITVNRDGAPCRPPDCRDALFPHRMATGIPGTGLGASLLNWVCELAAREGKAWVRIDVWKTNTRLHRYYRCLGFEPAGIADIPHYGSGALFARRAGTRIGTGPHLHGGQDLRLPPAP